MNKRILNGHNLTIDRLLIFNIIEYSFIQCTLTILFTNGQTLCYRTDGQNGLEFVFTGWIAIPILIVFSYLFDNLREIKISEVKADRLSN
jgi:hypothetical protein